MKSAEVKPIEWIEPEQLNKNPAIRSRGLLASKWCEKEPDDISATVSYMTLGEHKSFVREITSKLNIELKGVGAEIGAGASVLSNSIATIFPQVTRIYAIEIVPEMAYLLQPKIISHTGNIDRIQPVIGSFDEIKIPDSSLDFLVEFDSLHHSDDLNKTLCELSRVLKVGGKLVAFDRAQPNEMTDEQLRHLLSIEYSSEFKKTYNIPVDERFTRAQNGEHEPRMREWILGLKNAGFQVEGITIFTKRTFRGFLKAAAAQIPFSLRSRLGWGEGLTASRKILLYYFFPFLGKFLKIQELDAIFKTPGAPTG